MEEDILDIEVFNIEEGLEQNNEDFKQIDENPEKQKYINDNIISKGYNLDDLSRSITIRTGFTINEISFAILKKEIDFFIKEQIKESTKIKKETKSSTKMQKNELIKLLYSPEHYQLKTHSQPKNKLIDLNSENIQIHPQITEAHQEKLGGIISNKVSYFFTIKCPELNTEVGRTIEDFEFYHKKLIERYPYKYIPPLFPKIVKNQYSHELIKRYLNRFLEYICQRKILRTSPITYEFLELKSDLFFNYKRKLSLKNYYCKYNMENYITMRGILDIDFNQDKISETEKIYKKLDATKSIYKNLSSALGKIVKDLNELQKDMNQASNAFSALTNYSKESNQSPTLVICYEKLKDIFNQWSESYNKQKFFFNNNFKEFFDYYHLQINALAEVEKQRIKIKNDYESNGLDLYAKKEKLFSGKKYNTWGLTEENLKNIDNFKNDKESAFKVMLPGMTNVVIAQKAQMASATIIAKKEYEIFMKRQGINLKDFLLSLKDKNQDMVSDAFALCSLFNIELNK